MSVTKILHVIQSLNPAHGGPMQALRNYLPEISKRGYSNEVLSLDDPGEPFIGKDDFVTHALGPNKRPWAYAAKALPWLKENVQRFDIIIVHGLWQYHSFVVYKAIKWMKENSSSQVPPVFVMPHGMLDPYFQKAPERRLKAIRNNIYWRLIEGKVVNTATGLLFTCEEELQLARQTFASYRPKKELNIGFGIAEPPSFTLEMEEAFAKHCPDKVKGQPFLLFLSRIHPKKGIDLLIKAYATIHNEYKQKGEGSSTQQPFPFLLVAGPGLETVYGQQMQALVKELNLTDRVFFPGMLTGSVKWGAFYACDAFVLSSHQENFGIAVAEALACNKPVLISNQINIWREIKNSGAGLVAEDTLTGTVALLKQWMESTANEKKEMGNAARACYKKHFAVESAAHQMLQAVVQSNTSKEFA